MNPVLAYDENACALGLCGDYTSHQSDRTRENEALIKKTLRGASESTPTLSLAVPIAVRSCAVRFRVRLQGCDMPTTEQISTRQGTMAGIYCL